MIVFKIFPGPFSFHVPGFPFAIGDQELFSPAEFKYIGKYGYIGKSFKFIFPPHDGKAKQATEFEAGVPDDKKEPYIYQWIYTSTQIMKWILFGIFVIGLCATVMAQDSTKSNKYDPTAIMILDRMSDVIGEMNSCSFKTSVANDVSNPEFGTIREFVNSEIFMVGPDKMMLNYHGPKGHRQIWYDSTQYAIFDYEEKNYALVEAPNTIIAMIDSIHQHFEFDFPAADFFYPNFTDDLLDHSDRIALLGRTDINGAECFHILAKNTNITAQIWINNDAYNLPAKLVINYHSKPGNPQYECTFSDWHVNPNLPNAIFRFVPPPGAHRVRLMPADTPQSVTK